MPKKEIKKKKARKNTSPPKPTLREEFGWDRDEDLESSEDWDFDDEKW